MTEKKQKLPADSNQLAQSVVEMATDEERTEPEGEKNLTAVAIGQAGGPKGSKARAKALTPEQRRGIAKAAAAERWGPKPRK